jgi:methylated-DNA-[protein]-cysteine S-methyltransferase
MHSAFLPSPIGPLYVESDGDALTALYTNGHRRHDSAGSDLGPFAAVAEQLDAYFAGELTAFELPLAAQGSEFEHRVWDALCEIPYGETVSYGTIAARIGEPGAARAVGRANGRNPISIIVPCHRVIGADGSLTGYGGGLPTKRALLDLERGVGSLYGVPQPR